MASNLYNQGLLKLSNGTINFLTDNIGVALLSSSATFNKAHVTLDQVTANEVSNSTGTGYERKTLANKSITLVGDSVQFDADDVLYSAITTSQFLGSIVVFKNNGSDATNELIAFIDYNDLPTNGSDVNIQFNANGIFRINNNLT